MSRWGRRYLWEMDPMIYIGPLVVWMELLFGARDAYAFERGGIWSHQECCNHMVDMRNQLFLPFSDCRGLP